MIDSPKNNDYESNEWKNFIIALVSIKRSCFTQIIRTRLKDFYTYVLSYHGKSTNEKLYNYLYNPTRECELCKAPVTFRTIIEGYNRHCSRKCNRNNPLTLKKQKLTCLKRYGVEHSMQYKPSRMKYIRSMMSKYNSKYPFSVPYIIRKIKDTKTKNGSIVADNDRSDFEKYKLLVTSITNKQPYNLLRNYEYKGRNKMAFSLDHKYSIMQGFKDKIDPNIIGNIVNLEYIKFDQNSSKQANCSIGKEELLRAFLINTKSNSN